MYAQAGDHQTVFAAVVIEHRDGLIVRAGAQCRGQLGSGAARPVDDHRDAQVVDGLGVGEKRAARDPAGTYQPGNRERTVDDQHGPR
ncbi:hypothetical protein D3C72_1441480 [compost metagenome]